MIIRKLEQKQLTGLWQVTEPGETLEWHEHEIEPPQAFIARGVVHKV